jgi:hypothetical protein
MSSADTMKSYLPKYYGDVVEMNEITKVEGQEIDDIKTSITDILNQYFINTATWGLAKWEKDFKIPTDEAKSTEERRSVIKSKKRGIGKVDANLIKLRCDAYTNGDVAVSFNGAIIVKFTSVLGTPPNFGDLVESLEQIKPVHLRIEFEYKYLLVTDVESMTITELDATLLSKFAGGSV